MDNDELLLDAVVAAELTEALDACRITPEVLAERIGVPEVEMAELLSGDVDIPMDTLLRSSSALGILAADLIEHAEDAVRAGHRS